MDALFNGSMEDVLSEEILLAERQIGRVIGKGGASIKRIKAECGAHFFVDNSRKAANGDVPLEIYALSAEQMELAKRLVMERAKESDIDYKLNQRFSAQFAVEEPARKLPESPRNRETHLDTLFGNMKEAFNTILRDMVAVEMKSAMGKSRLPNVPLCKGCHMRKSEVLFDCGHFTHCYGCALRCTECPSCRAKLVEKTRLFNFPK